MDPGEPSPGPGPRERILTAAAKLLAEGGRDAASTRAVGAAADVKAPTIYRLFGDMQGLLDAVAAEGFTAYLKEKTGLEPTADPVQDLRIGWDLHVGFGLAHPALYLLMNEPGNGTTAPSAVAGEAYLAAQIRRIAQAGRLRVGEALAAHLVQAGGRGTTLTLITMPPDRRDPELSVLAREAVITAITTEAPVSASPGPVGAAVALHAVLPQTTALTDLERGLLEEWLDRIITARR